MFSYRLLTKTYSPLGPYPRSKFAWLPEDSLATSVNLLDASSFQNVIDYLAGQRSERRKIHFAVDYLESLVLLKELSILWWSISSQMLY